MFEQGIHNDFVSVIMSSWENNMRAIDRCMYIYIYMHILVLSLLFLIAIIIVVKITIIILNGLVANGMVPGSCQAHFLGSGKTDAAHLLGCIADALGLSCASFSCSGWPGFGVEVVGSWAGP